MCIVTEANYCILACDMPTWMDRWASYQGSPRVRQDGDVVWRAVTFSTHDVAIPAKILSWNGLVPSTGCSNVKNVSVSIDFGHVLTLGVPAACVFVRGVAMHMEAPCAPGKSLPASRELLRYLNAVEQVLFGRSWISRCCGSRYNQLATQVACIALFIVVQCVTVNVQDFSLTVHADLKERPSNSSILPLSTTGNAVEVRVASLRIIPARPNGRSSTPRIYGANVRVDVSGLDLICSLLPHSSSHKVMRRWGFEAGINMWNHSTTLLSAADIHVDAAVASKAVIMQCSAVETLVLSNVVQQIFRCQTLGHYAIHRPRTGVLNDPSGWWRYAARCVLQHICEYSDEPCWPVHHLRRLPALLKAYTFHRLQPGETTSSFCGFYANLSSSEHAQGERDDGACDNVM